MKSLIELSEDIDKCVRCGACRSVCPVFKVVGREGASTRGKMALIQARRNGALELTETYLRAIKDCTLCGACQSNCPNDVNTTAIIAAARAESIDKLGMPLAASLVFKNLLEPNTLMDRAFKWATRFQGLVFRDSPVENGLLARFTLPFVGMGKGRLLPQVVKTFFLDMPEAKAASGGKGKRGTGPPRVAFYAGCGVNFLMPDIGIKSLEVIKRAGAEAVVPPGQVCCGMPAFSTGDVFTAREMARKNLEVFEAYELDFITTACATCGYGLKTLMRELLGDDPALKGRVEAFTARVRDINELLVNELKLKGGENRLGAKTVTYHDPCHLGRAQGVREEPRELIAGGRGVTLKEMKNPCACCGLGGGLSLSNYELSVEIARKKAENIRASGADVVVTACPGCMVQLRDGLHRFGVDAKVAHVVELL
ncbi:MAG: (Fe-S)-binding protein [Deltaproteobacteria bacterium]|nr:(Fe-S)-binding protein [Deltaproteobacteria bacterium]